MTGAERTGKKGYLERATPTVNRDTCTGCGLCAKVCGGQPLVMIDGKAQVDSTAALGCLACAQCMLVCPTGSISVEGRNLSGSDVFDLEKNVQRTTIDDLEQMLVRRRSIRVFEDRDVDRALVERVVRIASTAPMGIPPSEVGVLVVHGHDKVRELANDTLDAIRQMMRILNPVTLALFRPFMKRADYEGLKEFVLPLGRTIEAEKAKGRDSVLYGAPVALLFHRSPYSDPADPYIAATYAMIAAEAAGLGTCMIGIVPLLMERDKKMMMKYGLPKGNKPALVVIMGYPVLKYKRGVRRRFASVSHLG